MAEGRPAAASSMALPRKATSSTAVTASKTPAAWRAEYSPRDSPAAAEGTTPCSRSTAVSPAANATMQGWVYRVWFRTPPASVKETSFKSKSTRSAAWSMTARKAGYASYRSAPMPGCWLPCPAYKKPSFILRFSILR